MGQQQPIEVYQSALRRLVEHMYILEMVDAIFEIERE